MPTARRPFAGSPAEGWASGPDGIVPPPARAVGALSTARVAAAPRLTKSFPAASNLDPDELRGGRPQTAIGLIDPQETTERGRMETALRTPGADHDAADFFTRHDPTRLTLVGGTRPAPPAPDADRVNSRRIPGAAAPGAPCRPRRFIR